jgi:hypothetical protein
MHTEVPMSNRFNIRREIRFDPINEYEYEVVVTPNQRANAFGGECHESECLVASAWIAKYGRYAPTRDSLEGINFDEPEEAQEFFDTLVEVGLHPRAAVKVTEYNFTQTIEVS